MTATYATRAIYPPPDSTCPTLWEALRDVADPEMPISVVDLGMIVAISIEAGVAAVALTFTAMGCFAAEFIMDDIRARLLREPDVRAVTIEVVWQPIWTKERISAEGIETLQMWGVSA